MNDEHRTFKKDWQPTPEAFEKLLLWLDPDIDAAAEKYEKIREKLNKLFKWRNCTPEEDYTDITINRVNRRIWESTAVDVKDPYTYFHGTALNVIREYWKREQKYQHEDIEKPGRDLVGGKTAVEVIDERASHNAEAHRYHCMHDCLRRLPSENRELIVAYHNGENKKEIRKQLADKMKVPINVLRIRACRIRDGLQSCVDGCVKKRS